MMLEKIPGAIKIGSTTAAAVGTISTIGLPGVIGTNATFSSHYYPDYTPTGRIGIVPDYYVYPTIQGIREGRDEVLEFALNCDFVGVKDVVKNEEEVVVYPNPTTGELRITNYELRDGALSQVEVFDVFGRKISSHHLIPTSSHHLINISHLPAGIYFLQIRTEKNLTTKKIIKY
jgi:hypothetical protein